VRGTKEANTGEWRMYAVGMKNVCGGSVAYLAWNEKIQIVGFELWIFFVDLFSFLKIIKGFWDLCVLKTSFRKINITIIKWTIFFRKSERKKNYVNQ
jgi:hypothetical protein